MHGQYIRSTDRQLISEEDMFLWLSRGDLKGETESKGITTKEQALQKKLSCNKNIYKQKQIANADYVNNLMRQ